jgi:hypothetical protein
VAPFLLEFSGYQGASLLWEMFLVFSGATVSRVLRKVKLSSSVRRLTDFCPLTSLGRQRESGRTSRNLCVVCEFIARLLMFLGWDLSRLFVGIANVKKWWSDSPGLWGKTLRSTTFILWDKTRYRVWLWQWVGPETCWTKPTESMMASKAVSIYNVCKCRRVGR